MKSPLFLLLASIPLYAAEAPIDSTKSTGKSHYSIDPKSKSADWVEAYDLLRKEKPTLKISLRTSNTTVIANVIEMAAASNGTLLFVKIQSNLGPKTLVIPVEEVEELYYSA